MPRSTRRCLEASVVPACLVVASMLLALALSLARADDAAPDLSIRGPAPRSGRALPPTQFSREHVGVSAASGGWWVSTAGIAVALALLGGISLAARRLLPARSAGPLEVVGRASLSPKHTVYLLRAGGRVLIVGTGTQGPPALLGEWAGPIDQWRLDPSAAVPSGPNPAHLDRRIGDEP